MNQYPIDHSMASQQMSIPQENNKKIRNEEYENIYGKPQQEGLSY